MPIVNKAAPLIIEIPNILTVKECDELIGKINQLNPSLATVRNDGEAEVNTNVRNNERVIFNDSSLAEKLFLKAQDYVPSTMQGRILSSANECFRCYRYKVGMKFSPHYDGSLERNGNEKSYYSFLVYLNDDFEGGQTNFLTESIHSITPRKGFGLLFQHLILHEGAEVSRGVKYVARTDLMYQR